MDTNKIIYYVSTAILTAIMAFSIFNYFTNYETIARFFQSLGFPTYLIYPLAVAKILGIIAILYRKQVLLKEWAYAGFFFDTLLALSAHYLSGDGAWGFAAVGMLMVVVSRVFEQKSRDYVAHSY